MTYKTTDPSMAVLLMPMYLDTWESKEQVCFNLCKQLSESPEDILFLLEVNEDHVDGILVAYKDDDRLVVWQANGIDVKSVEPYLVKWGQVNGCNKMSIRTHRSPKAWARKYKLKLDKTERVNGMMRYEMSRAI
jgi:hypothetical protein